MGRVKQFISDITSEFRQTDEKFLKKLLNEEENKVFHRLRKAEMLHLISVAKGVETLYPGNDDRSRCIVKAALFHDIGKAVYPVSAFGKAYAVIMSKIVRDRDEFIKKSRIMDVYYNHPSYGVKIMRELGSFDRYPYLYDLIEFHHLPEDEIKKKIPDNIDVYDALKEFDERN